MEYARSADWLSFLHLTIDTDRSRLALSIGLSFLCFSLLCGPFGLSATSTWGTHCCGAFGCNHDVTGVYQDLANASRLLDLPEPDLGGLAQGHFR
jgi:hypothetical protein